MKFLGLDYGTKRIGVAISDDGGTLAFPKAILPNDLNIFEKLDEIFQGENIREIIIGESTDFSGKPNPLSTKIEIFILELRRRFKLPIHRQKDFLTSVEARRYKKLSGPAKRFKNNRKELGPLQTHNKLKRAKNSRADAAAAALILQRYLDKINK